VEKNLAQAPTKAVLARPDLTSEIQIDPARYALVIRGRAVPVEFDNVETHTPQHHYDLAILATSRRHVNDGRLLERLAQASTYVLDVAENLSKTCRRLLIKSCGTRGEVLRFVLPVTAAPTFIHKGVAALQPAAATLKLSE
jgi:hypothetical protein